MPPYIPCVLGKGPNQSIRCISNDISLCHRHFLQPQSDTRHICTFSNSYGHPVCTWFTTGPQVERNFSHIDFYWAFSPVSLFYRLLAGLLPPLIIVIVVITSTALLLRRSNLIIMFRQLLMLTILSNIIFKNLLVISILFLLLVMFANNVVVVPFSRLESPCPLPIQMLISCIFIHLNCWLRWFSTCS